MKPFGLLKLAIAIAFIANLACEESAPTNATDAGTDVGNSLDGGAAKLLGAEVVLCRGTSDPTVPLDLYMSDTKMIAGVVTEVTNDASTLTATLAPQRCGYPIKDLPAFSVRTLAGEVWNFALGTATPSQNATKSLISLDFLKNQSVSVMFKHTQSFGSAQGMVVRDEKGSLLLAVDNSGFGPGLVAADVPELTVSRGESVASVTIPQGIVNQTRVSFQGDTSIQVLPGEQRSIAIGGRPCTVGVGLSFTYTEVFATDTVDKMSWFVSAGP